MLTFWMRSDGEIRKSLYEQQAGMSRPYALGDGY